MSDMNVRGGAARRINRRSGACGSPVVVTLVLRSRDVAAGPSEPAMFHPWLQSAASLDCSGGSHLRRRIGVGHALPAVDGCEEALERVCGSERESTTGR